jgi:hypothetical protein
MNRYDGHREGNRLCSDANTRLSTQHLETNGQLKVILYQRAEYDRLVRFFASWQYQDQHLWDTGPGVSVSYLYDDNGIRVKKTAGGVATYYVSPIDEISGSTVTKYYYPSRPAGTRLRTSFGGQRIAMKKGACLPTCTVTTMVVQFSKPAALVPSPRTRSTSREPALSLPKGPATGYRPGGHGSQVHACPERVPSGREGGRSLMVRAPQSRKGLRKYGATPFKFR